MDNLNYTKSRFSARISNFFARPYTVTEWTAMKFCFMLCMFPLLSATLLKYNSQPYPEGICELVDCSLFAHSPINYIVIVVFALFCGLYIMERWMLGTTFVLSLLFLIILSLERSNGVYHRAEILSTIVIGQFLGYLFVYLGQLKNIKLFERFRHQSGFQLAINHSIQLLAVSYVISSVTKLQVSGLNWIIDSPNIALQVIKSVNYHFYDMGGGELPQHGWQLAQKLYENQTMVRLIATISISLELFCIVAVFSKKSAFVYGILLFIFHMFIFATLGTLIMPFVLSIFIFFLDGPYLLYRLFVRFVALFKRTHDTAIMASFTTD